jgi:hypothetical protein
MKFAAAFTIVALGLPFAALPAFATETGADQASVQTDPNELVCKRIAETGSRVKKVKVCKTRAEWDAIAEDAKSTAKDINRKGSAGAPDPRMGGG